MRSEGTVCFNLTSRMFFRLTNDTTYLTENEGQKICAVFSENAPLQARALVAPFYRCGK